MGLNFRLKGYVLHHRPIYGAYGPYRGMVIAYYNFAAGRFHTKNFVADFIRLKLNFIYKKKKQKSLFEPPFRGLKSNVRTPSI